MKLFESLTHQKVLVDVRLLLLSCQVVTNSLQPPWTAAHQASLPFTASSQSLLKSIDSMMPPSHLILCHPRLLLPSVFPSIRVFSNELALCIQWPKYRRFSTSPSNEYSGLISFWVDWFDLLVVQGTLRSFLSTTVWKHQFFSTQPS